MIESEQGVIGCCLMDCNAIAAVQNILRPEMFQIEFYSYVFETMLKLFREGKQFDLIILSHELETTRYDTNTMNKDLFDCLQKQITSTYIKEYAQEIIKAYQAREIKSMFSTLSLIPSNIEETMDILQDKILKLKSNSKDGMKPLSQIVEEQKSKHFSDIEDGFINTGFYKVDKTLGGLERGDVTVLAGRPGSGKTAFVMKVATNVSEKGNKVGFFSYEMNEKQLYERYVSIYSELEMQRIRLGKSFLKIKEVDEKSEFESVNKFLSSKNIDINTDSITVEDIRSCCVKHKYDLIIIDYLQLIEIARSCGNKANDIADLSRTLKKMAKSLNMHIIVLSQLKRVEGQNLKTKEPFMTDLRDSGAIESDASNVILLWDMCETVNRFKGCKIDKCRNGTPNTKIGLNFTGEHMRFEERIEEFFRFEQMTKDIDKGIKAQEENETVEDKINMDIEIEDIPFEII